MGKVILSMMATLDGRVSGPHGELDWFVWKEAMDRDAARVIQRVDTMLVGYGAYKDMARYWPAAAKNANTTEGERAFAQLINDKPKIVFSRTRESLLWNNDRLLVTNDLAKDVAKLKQTEGDMVFYGGVRLAQSFAQLALADEYRLLISPVALGRGELLFKDGGQRIGLKMTEAKTYPSGVVLLCYERV
jgi:dihydrofolate reductase